MYTETKSGEPGGRNQAGLAVTGVGWVGVSRLWHNATVGPSMEVVINLSPIPTFHSKCGVSKDPRAHAVEDTRPRILRLDESRTGNATGDSRAMGLLSPLPTEIGLCVACHHNGYQALAESHRWPSRLPVARRLHCSPARPTITVAAVSVHNVFPFRSRSHADFGRLLNTRFN